MRTELLDYVLPEHAIAQYPRNVRGEARLCIVEDSSLRIDSMLRWCSLIPKGALVVVNDTKVMRARLLGRKLPGGGQVELLLTGASKLGSQSSTWVALARPARRLQPGALIAVGQVTVEVVELLGQGRVRVRREDAGSLLDLLERHGHVPLPPYVKRADEPGDAERYQTVFAEHPGAVAAPTAGLHLTQAMLSELTERGVDLGRVTLHVGSGTFLPVKVEDLDQHPMHAESFVLSERLAEQVSRAQRRGGPVVAVGTTVVRALETAADDAGGVRPGAGMTRLLIQPGFTFKVVDSLLTNFHAPRSTLLALVAAFIGLEQVHAAYRFALGQGLQFLSYGDAMWLPRRTAA